MTLHHLAIICSSEESIKFYEKLGFQEFFRKIRSYDTVVLMRGLGTQLELFVDPNHPQRATNPEPLGLRHIAFKVDDFDKTIQEFDCCSVEFDWLGERYCTICDPDGLSIELHE